MPSECERKQPVPTPRPSRKDALGNNVITQQPSTYTSPFHNMTTIISSSGVSIEDNPAYTTMRPNSPSSKFYSSSDGDFDFVNIDIKTSTPTLERPKPKPRPKLNKAQPSTGKTQNHYNQVMQNITPSEGAPKLPPKPTSMQENSNNIYQNTLNNNKRPSIYEDSQSTTPINNNSYNSKFPNNITSLQDSFGYYTDSLLYETEPELSSLLVTLQQQIQTQEHQNIKQQTVEKILSIEAPFSEKYNLLPITKYLSENEMLIKENRLPIIFGMLEQYTSNLLIPEEKRHHLWRKIPTFMPAFKEISTFKDSVNILQEIGYVNNDRFFIFPENMIINEKRVLEIATDLCIAKYEITHILKKTHIHMDAINRDPDIPSYMKDNRKYSESQSGKNVHSSEKTNSELSFEKNNEKTTSSFEPSRTSSEGYWSCSHCTMRNPNSITICNICSKSRYAVDNKQQKQNLNEQKHDMTWSCTFCTLLNPIDVKKCKACEKPREDKPAEQKPPVNAADKFKIHGQVIQQETGFFETKNVKSDPFASSKSFNNNDWKHKDQTDIILKENNKSIEKEKFENQSWRDQQVVKKKENEIKKYDVEQSQKYRDAEIARKKELEIREFDERKNQLRDKQRLERQRESKKMDNLMELLKAGENQNFTVEETFVAIHFVPSMNITDVLAWLKTNFTNTIKDFKKFCDSMQNGDLGEISLKEAKEIFVLAEGNLESAKSLFSTRRQKQITELMKFDNDRKNIVEALFKCDGKEERATFLLTVQKCLKNNPSLFESLKKHPTMEEYEKDLEALKDQQIELEKKLRIIMGEFQMSHGKAKMCWELIEEGSEIYDALKLGKDTPTPDLLHKRLNVECNLCLGISSELKIISLIHCECKFCWDCYADFLSHTIKNDSISKLSCPKCGLPKIEPGLKDHFEYIEQQIIYLVKKKRMQVEVNNIFQTKLREFFLSSQENFRWCAHCQEGFLWENERTLKMNCPNCRKSTCFGCKEKWEDQHDGLTCEQYRQWKVDNDPNLQNNAVNQLLNNNNCIVCPGCTARYELARGGCMHFTCRCKYQFCSGCYNKFHLNSQECDYFENCEVNGLHAHHPRNCSYYTRDYSIEELKKLLDDANVEYKTELPEERRDEENIRCNTLLQDEDYNDYLCNDEILENAAGLCRKHYSEHLTMLLFFNRVDTISLYTLPNLTNLYRRERKNLPDKLHNETDADYLVRLKEVTNEIIPLPEINNVFPRPRAHALNVNNNIERIDMNILDSDSDESIADIGIDSD